MHQPEGSTVKYLLQMLHSLWGIAGYNPPFTSPMPCSFSPFFLGFFIFPAAVEVVPTYSTVLILIASTESHACRRLSPLPHFLAAKVPVDGCQRSNIEQKEYITFGRHSVVTSWYFCHVKVFLSLVAQPWSPSINESAVWVCPWTLPLCIILSNYNLQLFSHLPTQLADLSNPMKLILLPHIFPVCSLLF